MLLLSLVACDGGLTKCRLPGILSGREPYTLSHLRECTQPCFCITPLSHTCRVLQTLHLFKELMPDTHVVLQALLPRGGDGRGPRSFAWPNAYTRPFQMTNLHFRCKTGACFLCIVCWIACSFALRSAIIQVARRARRLCKCTASQLT